LLSLIDVVSMGLPERPPQPRSLGGRLLRGQHPCIPADARIVLWGGGIWDWLDPLTLVRAWPAVLAKHPAARLVFLGTRHPNPLVPPHAMVSRTEELAAEIGEKDKTIIFIDWLSYSDRETLLVEADIGALLHPLHIETRFSIRTRMLDYLWARLPVLITRGDVTSTWVQEHGIGRVIPPFDAAAAAEALCALLDQPKTAFTANFDALHALYRWPRVVQPLLAYCLHGTPAPDRPRRRSSKETLRSSLPFAWRFSRAWFILRHEGVSPLLHRLGRYIQWRILR
jgi:glycosyltransferase involved in cell wall biosynthesis